MIQTLYKLTGPAPDYETYNKTKWGEGVTYSGTGKGPLCSEGWIHAYTHPLLAVMLNPIHGQFAAPLTLWQGDGEIELDNNRGLIVGCKTFTTVKIIEAPTVTTVQRVAFALLCTLEVYHEPGFLRWANGWLAGTDRTESAAESAAASAAAWAAAWAASAAACAASAAAWAASAAAWAASAAACAAESAAENIDLIALAKKAMEVT